MDDPALLTEDELRELRDDDGVPSRRDWDLDADDLIPDRVWSSLRADADWN
jgi:hypothetical protein